MRKTLSKYVILILTSLLFTASGGQTFENSDKNDPQKTVESFYEQWTSLENSHSSKEKEEKQLEIVNQLFNLSRLAPQIVQKRWAKLSSFEQTSFLNALRESIKNKLNQELRSSNANTEEFEFKEKAIKENFATLRYNVNKKNEAIELVLYLLKDEEGDWKITNTKFGKNSLLRYYYGYCDKLLKKYSMPYLIGELGEYGYVELENFEASDVDKLPKRWNWKDKDNKKNKPYYVKEENGNKYLAAKDQGESVIIGKDIKWNLKKYPYVSFRWRVHEIPEGADERFNKKIDSAAGVYFVFKKKLGFIPESVKYVWSSTLPVGSAMRRSGIGKPWMVVAESGKEHLGEWRTYVFNAYEAYRKTFGGKPPDTPVGVGILSDANSMRKVNPDAVAYADYDDIRALKHADADSGVKVRLKAE